MRKTLLGFLLVLSFVGACSPQIPPTPTPLPPTRVSTFTPSPVPPPTPTPMPTPTPAYPDLAIEMVRTGGLLRSAHYRLRVDASGNVSYVSYAETNDGIFEVKGSAKIIPQQIDELVAAIEKADVFALEDSYYDFVGMDLPEMYLIITLNGRTKRVSQYPALRCSGDHSSTAPQALCDLELKIQATVNLDRLVKLAAVPTFSTLGGTPSSASVAVTVFVDANGDATLEPNEGVGGIAVQLIFSDGKVLSTYTSITGQAQFDLSGYAPGTLITATLPGLHRMYRFFLPQAGTVPIIFTFAQPPLPGNLP